MKYNHFISKIQKNQTPVIKAIAFPGCCTMDEIPDVFASLLSEIVQILDVNHRLLCGENQVLAVIGMQFGPPMLESQQPLILNRIFSPRNFAQHFCLVLQYLAVESSRFNQAIDSWYGSENLMIDFTTGNIMDAEYYLSFMTKQPRRGICLGKMSEHAVEGVWQQLRNNYPPELRKAISEKVGNHTMHDEYFFEDTLSVC